jgi:anaerobic magnesium-protoporphyrin IX monomethyl ester cyclase
MMFRGHFDTDFYRAVRDLLHAQVSLGHLDAEAQSRGGRELEQRWTRLVASVSTADTAALTS